jgi:hypothetical protein
LTWLHKAGGHLANTLFLAYVREQRPPKSRDLHGSHPAMHTRQEPFALKLLQVTPNANVGYTKALAEFTDRDLGAVLQLTDYERTTLRRQQCFARCMAGVLQGLAC